MVQSINCLACVCALLLVTGCSGKKNAAPREKQPRPVSVIKLRSIDPNNKAQLTGAAASWKTEELAFEVSGRVEFVIEPETDVYGESISEPTTLARIDRTRYDYKVNSAEAQRKTLEKQKKALNLEITKVIPAELNSAQAELRFQEAELDRVKPLEKSGAITKSELERIQADHDKAAAAVAQSEAGKESKDAELESLSAKIEEATQAVLDAERDANDTELFSPFNGQIAEVHVTKGAFVNAGARVLTVQMMNPIKIELEVSAEQSRRLGYKKEVSIALGPGQELNHKAIVYGIDPVADPSTRTFTITLLMENTKVVAKVPEELKPDNTVVRTKNVWRCFNKLGSKEGYLTENKSIHTDEQGAYIWKIKNWDDQNTEQVRVLDLEKVRVTAGEQIQPFLGGLWDFREVAFDPKDFNPEIDRLSGPLMGPGLEEFKGGNVLFDRPRWLVRPGDLVLVDLTGKPLTPGFYVPMDVISEQSGQYFVHIVDPDSGGVAEQVEVNVFESFNTQRRIEATGDVDLTEGMQLIAKGTHFIVDGERVLVAKEAR